MSDEILNEEVNNEEIVEDEEIQEEQPVIEQVMGVIYYESIFDNGMIGQFTESTALAYNFGWQDNVMSKDDVERSYDGHYYVKGKAPVKDLIKFKTMKLEELELYARRFEENECHEMVFMSSLGYPADGDRRSVQNVANLILVGEPTEYKFGDNSIHPCSVDDLKVLQVEMAKNGNNLYRQKFQMQYEISQLKTVEEVENYQIVFNMMDFTVTE